VMSAVLNIFVSMDLRCGVWLWRRVWRQRRRQGRQGATYLYTPYAQPAITCQVLTCRQTKMSVHVPPYLLQQVAWWHDN
jgi:hypothetical protein